MCVCGNYNQHICSCLGMSYMSLCGFVFDHCTYMSLPCVTMARWWWCYQTSSLKRPTLPLTVNSRVPTKVRQKFLDAYIDEYLNMGKPAQEAYSMVWLGLGTRSAGLFTEQLHEMNLLYDVLLW